MKKTFDFIEGFSIFFVEAEAQKSGEGRRFSEGAETFAATLVIPLSAKLKARGRPEGHMFYAPEPLTNNTNFTQFTYP